MIRSLTLRNAGPFRGLHELRLGPKAYAITARYESDTGRSNWAGKSFLLEMVDFALTGRLSKIRRFDADGWITKGERSGHVTLELEDGATITRERQRGKPTQVRYTHPSAPAAAQDAAEAAILRHLALTADDFRNVAYFEQKQMARLVHTEPSARMEIVRGWLGLEAAELAEAKAADIAGEAIRELTRLRAKLEATEGTIPEAPPPLEPLEAAVTVASQNARAKAKALEEVRKARAACGRDQEAIDHYERIVSNGKKLAAEVEALPADLEENAAETKRKWEAAVGAHAEAMRALGLKKRVTLGQFDGKCPVADLVCPAKERINDDRAAAAAAYAKADATEQKARTTKDAAHAAYGAATQALNEANRIRARLEMFREEAKKAMPEAKAARKRLAEAPSELQADQAEADYHAADKELEEARAALTRARYAAEQRERAELEADKLREAIDEVARHAAIATRTRGVFRATQRRVAERALTSINTWASSMLAEAGIDLAVALSWEHEGKGPAKQCEECGAVFPSSAKVKVCAVCGAQRGQLIVQRLEFLPSDRSGAADDIAGVSLQLAAGSWFLASRHSPWATAMLDEPLGACDRTNRRALSTQLARLVGSGVYRQALVISHNPDTVELYPGRIEIVVGRDGSRHIVQS